MKKIHYILIIILTFSCSNNSIDDLIQNKTAIEKEILDFYDFILEKEIDSSIFIADRPGFLLMKLDSALICSDSLFDNKDWENIIAQKKIFRQIKINNTRFNFINVDSILPMLKEKKGFKHHWEILDKNYKGLGFYSFSLPYFNKTRDLVIIESCFHCNGLCGHGIIRVFERRNNEWNYLKTLSCWIS